MWVQRGHICKAVCPSLALGRPVPVPASISYPGGSICHISACGMTNWQRPEQKEPGHPLMLTLVLRF